MVVVVVGCGSGNAVVTSCYTGQEPEFGEAILEANGVNDINLYLNRDLTEVTRIISGGVGDGPFNKPLTNTDNNATSLGWQKYERTDGSSSGGVTETNVGVISVSGDGGGVNTNIENSE